MNDDERTISDRLEGARPSDARPMAGFACKGPQHAAALDRVRAWTRLRFGLPDEAAVLVAEIACALPGCPPLETVVVFWTDEATRHRFNWKPEADKLLRLYDELLPVAPSASVGRGARA